MTRRAQNQLELEVIGSDVPLPSPESMSFRPPDPLIQPRAATIRDEARGSKRPEGRRELPRLALTFAESAAILGVSDEFFAQHVARELHFVRRGRKKLVAMRELERWLEESAARVAL